MSNFVLNKAKAAKNDEFYTQIKDIEKEIKDYEFWKFKKIDNEHMEAYIQINYGNGTREEQICTYVRISF